MITPQNPLPPNPQYGWNYDSSPTSHDNGSMLLRRYPAYCMTRNMYGWWGPDSLGTQTIDMTPACSGSGVIAKFFQFNYQDSTYYYVGAWTSHYSGTWNGNRARRLE